MLIRPITITDAKEVVRRWHRHHRAPLSGLFAIGVQAEDVICGVVIVGRPVARMLQDGWTVEVTRCCTDGTRNACSSLYSAAWRAAKGLGYHRIVTYTLPSEGGASLRATGWNPVLKSAGGSWSRKNRLREDHHPLDEKIRWEVKTSKHTELTEPAALQPEDDKQILLF